MSYSLAIHGWLLILSLERMSLIKSSRGQDVYLPGNFPKLFVR